VPQVKRRQLASGYPGLLLVIYTSWGPRHFPWD